MSFWVKLYFQTLPLFPTSTRGMRSRGSSHSSHLVSATPSSSERGLFMLFLCSTVRSIPWRTVLHELLSCWVLPMGCSSSWSKPAWVSSLGYSPSGNDCFSMGSPWGCKTCQKTCSSLGSPVRGVTAPARSGLAMGHSILQASPCSGMGSSMGCRWDSVLAPLAPRPPSLTWVSAQLFLSRVLPPASGWRCCCAALFPLSWGTLSQRCYHSWWWAWPWPAADLSPEPIVLAPSDVGAASSTFSQNSHL